MEETKRDFEPQSDDDDSKSKEVIDDEDDLRPPTKRQRFDNSFPSFFQLNNFKK